MLPCLDHQIRADAKAAGYRRRVRASGAVTDHQLILGDGHGQPVDTEAAALQSGQGANLALEVAQCQAPTVNNKTRGYNLRACPSQEQLRRRGHCHCPTPEVGRYPSAEGKAVDDPCGGGESSLQQRHVVAEAAASLLVVAEGVVIGLAHGAHTNPTATVRRAENRCQNSPLIIVLMLNYER